MIEAIVEDSTHVSITWRLPITPAEIGLGDLRTNPNNRTSLSEIQLDPTTLTVEFSGNVLAEASVTYIASARGFVANQTIALT